MISTPTDGLWTDKRLFAEGIEEATGIPSEIGLNIIFSYFNIETMCSSHRAYAALLNDGHVVTCGDPAFGGDSSSVRDALVDVKTVCSTRCAFAAVLVNGQVVTWGRPNCGGDSHRVRDELAEGVDTIYSTEYAFAAVLRYTGKVITWVRTQLNEMERKRMLGHSRGEERD